jgi:hypothetical protein
MTRRVRDIDAVLAIAFCSGTLPPLLRTAATQIGVITHSFVLFLRRRPQQVLPLPDDESRAPRKVTTICTKDEINFLQRNAVLSSDDFLRYSPSGTIARASPIAILRIR